MIDIHCHILSGIDDGAADMNESLAMAEVALADGITHIVATPHFTHMYPNVKSIVEAKVRELQQELDARGIGVTVRAGNEVRLESADYAIRHAEADAFGYLDPGKRFVLIEQRWSDYEPKTPDVIAWFRARGTTPIIAHPERHPFFRQDLGLLTTLIELGAWTQVTADSLLGKNGDDAREFALTLLRERKLHTLATDAHNVRRKPNLSEGLQIVREQAGAAEAEAVVGRLDAIRDSV